MIFKTGLAVILLTTAVLTAQDPAPPTIRVNTRLIEVSVVVHDKKGQPVRGLKKEDFSLRERGRERAIALFNADADSDDVSQSLDAALPDGVYSNRAGSAQNHISVILFDRYNTTFADQAFGREQLLRFTRQVQRGDHVAIYVLDSRSVTVLHDFTDNPDHLAEAIAALTEQSKRYDAADSPNSGARIDELNNANTPNPIAPKLGPIRSDWLRDPKWTPKALAGIAHHLAALSGRKNLIWVSGSFPLRPEAEQTSVIGLPDDFRTYEEEVTRTARALTAANIAIYPVDARGLITDPLFSASIAIPVYTAPKTQAAADAARAQLSRIFAPSGHETMVLLAEGTGGRALVNRNDIDGAIKDAVEDARVTYTLGFYSSEKDWDGKFHDVKVRVNRPGLEVRSRKGFVAVANPSPSATDLKAEVTNALASTLEATAIGMNARIQPNAIVSSKLSLALHVNGEDLHFIEQSNAWVGSLRLAFAQFSADGSRLSESEQPLDLRIPKPSYEAAIKNGFNLTKTIEPEASAEILKIVVVDSLTSRVGSLRIPISSKAPR